ncbi:TrbI/VirB10 family protein [Fulvimarina sp. 2208YS6-2-32]|uniref:TrbI/VirB10 family protein n=1 Tax=Fulvimarina uroteuthidis TaxID=3098149 RepID=A0ABU5I6B6_9HYPH|nr:TrbI/VirB10 family protein [Fulvimarina sp. 2208YS6-2-32]MDY8110927.1 TrbI/VirB10 family protein [Fulvimarina sp. 2208YS6-2-32]
MSENDDQTNAAESLDERLKALKAGRRETGRTGQARMSPIAAIGVTASLVIVGGLAVFSTLDEAEEPMATSAPAEFQPAGKGFGSLDIPEPVLQPAPEPEIVETKIPTVDPALMTEIAGLKSELDRLRNAPQPTPDTSEQDAAIADLVAQLDNLRAESAEAQEELQRRLDERDRQLRRLSSELEMAQLQSGPTQTGPSEEDLRLAELERRRQEAAAFQNARDASDMIAFGGVSVGSANGGDEQGLSRDAAFVRKGAATAKVTQAEVIANPSHTVPQGTLIQASLETALDSSLPGDIRAIVSENVHAFDGSRVLIPRGSRLVGRYQSDIDLAQERVTIAWDRIILPSNQSVQISAYGGDQLGRAGVTGDVDKHFLERFGSAALLSIVSAGPSLATASLTNPDVADTVEDVGGDFGGSTRNAIDESLSIEPTIRVPQGAAITVMVDRDLEIF